MFNQINKFIFFAHSKKMPGGRGQETYPEVEEKPYPYTRTPPECSKQKLQWKLDIFCLLLIGTDAQQLSSIMLYLHPFSFQRSIQKSGKSFTFYNKEHSKSAPVFENRMQDVCLTDKDPIKCSIYCLSINGVSYFTPVTLSGSQSHIPIEPTPQKYPSCMRKVRSLTGHRPLASSSPGVTTQQLPIHHPQSHTICAKWTKVGKAKPEVQGQFPGPPEPQYSDQSLNKFYHPHLSQCGPKYSARKSGC